MLEFVKLMDMAEWAISKAIKEHPHLFHLMGAQLKHIRNMRAHPELGKHNKTLKITAGFMTAWMIDSQDLNYFAPVIKRLRGP